jgi:hypothetical protein
MRRSCEVNTLCSSTGTIIPGVADFYATTMFDVDFLLIFGKTREGRR